MAALWFPKYGTHCEPRADSSPVPLPPALPIPPPTSTQHSPPDVPYRETVAAPAELPPEVAPKPPRVVEATTPSGACTLRVRAVPLPATLAMGLDQHADLLARLAGAGQVQRPC